MKQKDKDIIIGLVLSALCIGFGFIASLYVIKPNIYMTPDMMLDSTEYYRDETGSGFVESCITRTCFIIDNCCSLAYFREDKNIFYWCNGYYENGECVIEGLGYDTLGTEDIYVTATGTIPTTI